MSGYRERLVKFVESQKSNARTTRNGSHPPKACPLAERSPCFPGCSLPRSFPRSCMRSLTKCCISGERRTLTTKQVRETEAEAVAFVVCQVRRAHRPEPPRTDYIRLWHGDAKLLQESLEVVQHTAAVILGGIAPEPVAAAA